MSTLKPNETLKTNDAYIFGSLYSLDVNNIFTATVSYFGIEFQNHTTGKSFQIRFSYNVNEILLVIPVSSGEYSYSKFWFLRENGSTYDSKNLESEKFLIEAGKLYYIGNWVGSHKLSVSGNMQYHDWILYSLKDKFEEATTNLKAKYPKLSEMEAVNELLNLEIFKKMSTAK